MATMIGLTGRRKASPPDTTLPLPPTSTSKPRPTSKPNTKPSKKKTSTRPYTPRARAPPHASPRQNRTSRPSPDSDSELTPQSSDAEDDSMEIDLTPRKSKKQEPTSIDRKGKGKAHEPTHTPSKNPTGPAGRERKRNVKLEEVERRRARDDKFDLGHATTSSLSKPRDLDESSFGDDESDHGQSSLLSPVAKETNGLPDAFAGQDVEDLAYGAGFELENSTLATGGWWGSSDDETEEEEEGIYIDHLSGSEAERQSVSTNNGSDVSMSDSDEFSSSSGDEMDEFGFPTHPNPSVPMGPPDQRQLIIMENWKGELELVEPRQERSRRRDRNSTSRTAGSTGTSTVVSGEGDGLRIDPDEDMSDSSSWSALSEEDLDGGDTTDSMEEDDMPMLDSPAMQQLIGEQIGDIESVPSPLEPLGPSIIVTDTSVETPALSTSSSTPNPPAAPSTPGSATPANPPVAMPQMGTFHPIVHDPAQSAVIDGTKVDTKSPFTHKRRQPRGRKDSIASSSRSSVPTLPALSRNKSIDIFSPGATPTVDRVQKRARYSSIPGHPRYIKAKRAEQAQECECTASTSESDNGDVELSLSLEDMIEESVLVHESTAEESRHLIRFDTVPVATYMRRNYFSAPRPDHSIYREGPTLSSPIGRGGNDTLAGPLFARGLLNSPVLDPVHEGDEDRAASRKERRRRRKGGMTALRI